MVSESIYIYVTIRALTLGRYRNTILTDSSPVYSVPNSSRNQFLGYGIIFYFSLNILSCSLFTVSYLGHFISGYIILYYSEWGQEITIKSSKNNIPDEV